MSTLSFKPKDAVPPEKEVVYKGGRRVGVIRRTETATIFRVEPDRPSVSVTRVQEDPVVELTAEELREIAEHVTP
jgi:hypothetical protein